MRNQLVYDLPVRLFHWIFAGLFVGTFLIAKVVDDESAIFSYHMLAGLLMVFVVVLRIVWGFIGSRNARFSSFALKPRQLVAYVSGILTGDKSKWAGHNPASSWAALLMFAMALGLGVTGVLMASGGKKAFEDVHEVLANGFLVVVLLHVAGVILHGIRHQDGIALSMIDGGKKDVPNAAVITGSRPIIAAVFMVLVIGFASHLVRNFDSSTGTLKALGGTLTLGHLEDGDDDDGLKDKDNGHHHGHGIKDSDHDGDDD